MADERPQWMIDATRDHPNVLDHATEVVYSAWRSPILAVPLLLKPEEERTAAIRDSIHSIYDQMLAAGEK